MAAAAGAGGAGEAGGAVFIDSITLLFPGAGPVGMLVLLFTFLFIGAFGGWGFTPVELLLAFLFMGGGAILGGTGL